MNATRKFARLLALLGFATPAFAQSAEYIVVDLSIDLPADPTTLAPIYPSSRAAGINEAGAVLVTGQRFGSSTDAIVWDPNAVDVTPLAGVFPTGLDAAGNTGGIRPGSAAGWFDGPSGPVCVPDPSWCQSSSFFYATSRVLAMEEGGSFTGDLSMLAPLGSAAPYLPQVEAYIASFVSGALQVNRLGAYNGLSTVGWGINSLGEVVGTAGTATSALPVLYRQGQFHPLPVVRLAQNRATAINRLGLAVGYVSDATPSPGFNACEGAVWDVSDPTAPTLTTIGQWANSNRTLLQDISDTGVAVGAAVQNEVSVELWRRAIRWDATRGIVALDTLLGAGSPWVITDAVAINEAGQIAATGRLNGSTPRAIRLDPIPGTATAPRPNGAHGDSCASGAGAACPMLHGTIGRPDVGNSHFALSLSGARAGSLAYVALSFGACSAPGISVPGLCGPLWLSMPVLGTLGPNSPAGLGCGATTMFSLPLPADDGLAGMPVASQCIALSPSGDTMLSNCVSFVLQGN